MAAERTEALKGTWALVNELADKEDSVAIRAVIAEAGIEPNIHVGAEPDSFTPEMAAEWVLGQWADMIDSNSPFLNTARNFSSFKYGEMYPNG